MLKCVWSQNTEEVCESIHSISPSEPTSAMVYFTIALLVAMVGTLSAAPQFPSSPAPALRQFNQQQYRPQPFRGSSTPSPQLNFDPSPPGPGLPASPTVYNPLPKEASGNYYVIVKQAQEVNHDGTFNYAYETENGIQSSVQGALKNVGTPEEAQVIQGGYSYTAPDGTPIQVTFIADETGFHAEGAHLPQPPPIPPAIARSLEYLRSLPPSKDDQL